jgi:hypothetical protein
MSDKQTAFKRVEYDLSLVELRGSNARYLIGVPPSISGPRLRAGAIQVREAERSVETAP